MLVKASEIKKLAKEGNKRVSKEFIEAFEHQVNLKLKQCISEHNGGRKTLDAGVAHYVFGGSK